MQNSPFLTDVDPRTPELKGSRDPLGIQPIWARLGRHVVGNLTTITTSVRDFSVLLLGYYFISKCAEDRPDDELAVFLKWEQIAAFARAMKKSDVSLRGIERVRRILSNGDSIIISADRKHQIMSNQKTYGLWGLFSVAARNSCLLEMHKNRPTALTIEFVENFYMPKLGDSYSVIYKILTDKRATELKPDGIHKDLFKVLGNVLGELKPEEKKFYRTTLLLNQKIVPPVELQAKFVNLMEDKKSAFLIENYEWNITAVKTLIAASRVKNETELAEKLEKIKAAESILSIAAMLFNYLQGSNGESMENVINEIKNKWGDTLETVEFDMWQNIASEFAEGDAETGALWEQVAKSTNQGDYKELIFALLDLNKKMMSDRGGAPWIILKKNKLEVRFCDEKGDLKPKTYLKNYWKHPYFLNSLQKIAYELGA